MIYRICMHDQDYVMDFHLMVMLHSTKSPYGWLVIEVAYGEMIFSLHRGCMGDDSSRRMVGMSTWCIAHVWHTRINTSVGFVYIIFWFSRYKNLCICISFSKSICSIKEHLWSLTLSWPDKVQRMFSTAHEFSKIEIEPQTILWLIFYMSFVSKQSLLHYIYWFFA